MLSEYSVRKPYTVFVAVILIIVLGVVSFMGMPTDLLPTIDLPYVIVMTTYPGASPEKVEQTVTRPLEAALGTSGGLENISSISNENASIIILEFVQSTNMDSAMIELSGMIDMVEAYFPDMVGTPTVLKISPDMMPIVVASVDREGMAVDELSAFTTENVIPSFERIDGVASVSANGLIEKQYEIKLDEARIRELNEQIRADIESVLEENRAKLVEAQESLAEGKATLEEESTDQKTKIARASAQLNDAIASLNALLGEESLIEAEKAAYEAEKAAMQQLAGLNDLFAVAFPSGIAGLTPEMYAATIAAVSAMLPPEIASLPQAEMAALAERAASAPGRIAEINVQLQNITTREATVAAMKPQLESALSQAMGGYKGLEAGKITMAVELAKASIQIENGESEIEKGLSEFDKAREEALKSADLSKILTEDLVKTIVSVQNFSMPAGYIFDGDSKQLVKVGDSFGSYEEIRDMLLLNIDPVGDIRLSDIATLELTDNASELYSKVNGNDGVLLIFQKQSTASTAEVADSITDSIRALEKEYPDLKIRPLMNQGDYIHMITGSVIEGLLFGGLLAIILLLLFLRDIRPTVAIALSIPISLMFAVTLMYFSNITLNVISLSGLALGVGMLVDNSIVVIENIYRLRHEGMSAVKAAVVGAKQVAGAIFASTLTTMCVFLPIVFTEGLSRQLFTDMGLTIAYSLTASLIIALTLVPALGSTLLRSAPEKKHNAFDAVVRFYRRLLKGALRHKSVVLIPVAILLLVSLIGVYIMGTAFMPPIDSPQMSATVAPPDGTGWDEANRLNDEVMRRILEIDAVETVGVMSGGGSGLAMLGGMMSGSGDGATFYMLLKEERTMTNLDVERLIYEKTADMGVEVSVTASNMDLSVLSGSGVQVNIKGNDLDKLAEIAIDIAGKLSEVEGTANITTGLENAERETRIMVDKDKAMREGLTVAQIYAEISEALKTETEATVLSEGTDEFPVMIIRDNSDIPTIRDLGYYRFFLTEKDGTPKVVRLQEIATITEADSLRAINRDSQSRYMTVSSEIAEGYNIGLVSRDIEDRLQGYSLPAGYSMEIAGENEIIQESLNDLVLMILLAVVFIYLIMVAQFQDLTSPFIVLFTLPLAFTGGLLLLWAAGMELSVIAVLGFLVLAGVVVNNGIVFVDYVNLLRLNGLERREALLEAGTARIRPILLTALTTILAMSTLALGFGQGSEIMQPMAVVTVGGLIYATLLTLFVVPILYDLFHRKGVRKIDAYLKETIGGGSEGEPVGDEINLVGPNLTGSGDVKAIGDSEA
ncbi:MAG: efflux RND transporter permease subunit [Clostridiaceae bacterium]|jgi:HAE1 family hydrophobic/amphiphilic exporter-1|nr:efflux RND transporter permease subunit [Clostridiaceae bacterium]